MTNRKKIRNIIEDLPTPTLVIVHSWMSAWLSQMDAFPHGGSMDFSYYELNSMMCQIQEIRLERQRKEDLEWIRRKIKKCEPLTYEEEQKLKWMMK